MKFSINLIKKFVPITMSSEMLAELLTLRSVEVESIENVDDDRILDIKVLYNRGDLLSHIGMAREIGALTGAKIKNQISKIKENEKTKATDFIKVEIQNTDVCPRYSARVIQNIGVAPSPEWLKKFLESVGLRSINNIVDATNYVMLEMGQPLHAFDHERIAGRTIVVRNAHTEEMIDLLDESRAVQKLDPSMLVIADAKHPLAIAGVKGGKDSGITEQTETIVLESANFNGSAIRRTATALGLRTDASSRFQYGLDPNLTKVALNRAAELICQLAGGEVATGIVDAYPNKREPWQVTLKKPYLASLLGITIPDATVKKILKG